MSLQLYISYLNKHIVTLDINISLRLLPSVNTLNSKWKFKTILINKSQLLLKALYLEATLGTDRLFRPGGGGRGGVQKGVVYQNYTLSPPKIIALENCTPLCQEQFLKSTPPPPPSPLQPLQVSSSILAGRWFHKLYKDTDSQQRRVRFEGARREKVSQRVWGMLHQKIFKFRVSEMPSPAFSVRHFQ